MDQNSVSADIGYTYGYYYYFDIAPLVRNWYSGAADWQKGVVFRWNNDAAGTVMEKCFASTQYPTEAYRPRFEVTTQLTPPISNGIYFLNNAISGSYLDVENQLMQNGTIIHQWQFCGAHTSQWYFEWQGDGYYTIRSCKNLNYYLGVQSDSSADQAPVVLRSGTVTDGMKWKIVQYSSGKYKIIPKIGESLNRILAVQYSGTNQAADGLPIKSFTFSDDGYNSDLWILEAFGKTPCKLLSYEESNGAIRYEYFSAVSNKVCSYLGFNILQQNYTSLTKPQIKRYLFDTKIFIVHTHGAQNVF